VSLFRDEKGSVSMARTLLATEFVYVATFGGWGALSSSVRLMPEWWVFHGTLIIALAAWAGGPRAMEYLGPRIAEVGKVIGEAAKRVERTDDRRKDRESD